MYSQFCTVRSCFFLKTLICYNKINVLENNLNITEFSFVYMTLHAEETPDEWRNLNPDKPS